MTHRRSEKESRAEGWVKKSSKIGFYQRIKCAIGGQAAIKPLTGWSPAYGRKQNTGGRLQNRWREAGAIWSSPAPRFILKQHMKWLSARNPLVLLT